MERCGIAAAFIAIDYKAAVCSVFQIIDVVRKFPVVPIGINI